MAIAYDEGKLIGVLTRTGGISDLVADILTACAKETGAQVVYDAAPRRLVENLLRVYGTSHFRRPSCFCRDRPPGEEAGAMADAEWTCAGGSAARPPERYLAQGGSPAKGEQHKQPKPGRR